MDTPRHRSGSWRWLWLAATLSFPVAASAQPPPILEIVYGLHQVADLSVGFSMLSVEDVGPTERRWPTGIHAGMHVDVYKGLGAIADFGIHRRRRMDDGLRVELIQCEYLFGPRFRSQRGATTVFVHGLFGGITAGSARTAGSASTFAMGLGGGVDWNVHKRLAVRFIQLDWFPSNRNSVWQTDRIRLASGVSFRSARGT